MAKKIVAGLVTGIIGGVIWFYGTKFLVLLISLIIGQQSHKGSMASLCGLAIASIMFGFYLLKTVRQSCAINAWGHNMMHLGCSSMFCGGIAGFTLALIARLSYRDNTLGLILLAGSIGVGLALLLAGRVILMKDWLKKESTPEPWIKFLHDQETFPFHDGKRRA